MKNGLLIPDEKTCLKCHNEKVPEEVHAMAKKEEAKKEEGK